MDPDSPLGRHQIRKLEQLSALGVCTDESLAAFMRELGQPCDRSAITNYRDGRRAAPLGLLDIILGHVRPKQRIEVLDLWARPHGLHVVPDGDPGGDHRGLVDRVMELQELVGRLAAEVRSTLADGRADPDELERIAAVVGTLRRAAASLETVASDAAELRKGAA